MLSLLGELNRNIMKLIDVIERSVSYQPFKDYLSQNHIDLDAANSIDAQIVSVYDAKVSISFTSRTAKFQLQWVPPGVFLVQGFETN